MGISLITTVKNEEQSIGDFLSSIACQTTVPDEVVIVDGGSTDNTTSLIRNFKGLNIRCIEQRSNIASGRNLAIRNAQHEIIAVTDAGCRLRPDWLERITAPMGSADVVVGNYRPIVNSLFDACQDSIIGIVRIRLVDQYLHSFQSVTRISQTCLGGSGWLPGMVGLFGGCLFS